jgi:hypothetical protein
MKIHFNKKSAREKNDQSMKKKKKGVTTYLKVVKVAKRNFWRFTTNMNNFNNNIDKKQEEKCLWWGTWIL